MLVTQHISNIVILYYDIGRIWFIIYTLLLLHGFLCSCVISCHFIEFPALCALSKFVYLKTLLTFLMYIKVTHISFLLVLCSLFWNLDYCRICVSNWIIHVTGEASAMCNMMTISAWSHCFDGWSICSLCNRCLCASRFYIIGWTYGQKDCEWEA
jgi:hypothetical protein